MRYGRFFQLVVPVDRGHASIAFELHADPLDHVDAARRILGEHGLVAGTA